MQNLEFKHDYLLACRGKIKELSPEKITPEMLNSVNDLGETILQACIQTRTLGDLPGRILADPKVFQQENEEQETGFCLIIESAFKAKKEKNPRPLPEAILAHFKNPEVLTLKDTKQKTVLHHLAHLGFVQAFVPLKVLQDHPQLLLNQDEKGRNSVNQAAQSYRFEKFPPEVFTHKNLNSSDSEGYTAILEAALTGFLSHVPTKFLTPKSLSICNHEGENATSIILKEDPSYIKQIPIPVLASYTPRDNTEKLDLEYALKSQPEISKKIKKYRQKIAIQKANRITEIS